MTMFVSKTIFKSVINLSLLAGFLSIGNIKASTKLTMLIHIYLVILLIVFFFQVVALLIVLLFNYSLDDGSGVVCVLAIMINNVFLITFYFFKGLKVARNYDKVANLIEEVFNCPAHVHENFSFKIKKSSVYLTKLVRFYMISVYLLLVMEFLIKGLSYAKIVNLVTDHSVLIYVMPWKNTESTYWPTLIFQTISTALMTITQQANHYYLMTMMILQSYYFEFLRESLAFIISLKKETLMTKNLRSVKLFKPLLMDSYMQGYYDCNNSRLIYMDCKEMHIDKWIKMHNHFTRKGDIERHYTKMLEIIYESQNDPDVLKFDDKLKHLSINVNKFVKYFYISIYIVALLEFLIKVLSHMKVVPFDKEVNTLIFQVPYEATDNARFFPTLTLQIVSSCFIIAVDITNILYIQSMLILKGFCFSHLRECLAYQVHMDRHTLMHQSQTFCTPNIKRWIRRHSKLKSLCKEFVDIYTPLLVTYFMVMFVILISGVFSITQNQHYYGIVEEILLGLYFSGIIFNLFLLSVAGSNLSFESVRIFEEAFQAPWYDCSERMKSSLKIICTVSRRPIRMAAFGSEYFEMSLHTFIRVMKTMVSFYMALAQMKQMANL